MSASEEMVTLVGPALRAGPRDVQVAAPEGTFRALDGRMRVRRPVAERLMQQNPNWYIAGEISPAARKLMEARRRWQQPVIGGNR